MFKAGMKVVCVTSFENLRKIWGHNYPKIGDVVTVLSVRNYPFKYKHLLLIVNGTECEVCSKCFRVVDETFAEQVLQKVCARQFPARSNETDGVLYYTLRPERNSE